MDNLKQKTCPVKFYWTPTLWELVKYYLIDSGRGWIHHLIRRTDDERD